jgi:hypothetical protein
MRRCIRCLLEKEDKDFNGKSAMCRECRKEEKAVREILKTGRRDNRRMTEERKAYKNKQVVEWMKNNPEKISAHRKIGYEVKLGRIIRPKICEICGKYTDRIMAHHTDYSQPFLVVWVCPRCHGEIHEKVHIKRSDTD